VRSEADGSPRPRPAQDADGSAERCIEVFADVACPFTHVGLRRLVERRRALARDDVRLVVRAWPLELVNGAPMDPVFIAEEVDEIREQSAPEMFVAFRPEVFPSTSLPALALVAAGYRRSRTEGEVLSLLLREALFEHGVDIADPAVLGRIAAAHDLVVGDDDHDAVRADLRTGAARGVIGSPHFFTPTGDFFCPALDVRRDDEGRLQVHTDPDAFDAFVDSCFSDDSPSRT
jgi:predicted DsbA family dithiol-disulfide isomerase